MFKFLSLFNVPRLRRKPSKIIRELRRLTHQRNFWRNKTRELRGRRKR
jgi:hypothetical protein